MVCNFQTKNNKNKTAIYVGVTQEVLFDSAVLAAVMSRRNCDFKPEIATVQKKAVIKMQCHYMTQYGENPP